MQISSKKLILAFLFIALLALMAMPVAANPFAGTAVPGLDSPPDTHTGKTPSSLAENPWQVALVFNAAPTARDGFVCGGSLINANWVLTAAHCVDIFDPEEIDVIIGRETLSSDAGEQIESKAFHIHIDWDGDNNDIALIKLARPATLGQFLPLQKASQSAWSVPGTMSKVTGWGVLSLLADNVPDGLHEVEMPIVTQAQCKASYENDPAINETVICAGTRTAGTDPCFGDSGGPLTVANPNGGRVLVGIVSFGRGCGFVGQYGVYTRVSTFEGWVMGQLSGTGGDEAIIVETLTAPAKNTFFQFSATTLPFGYEFVAGSVTPSEIVYFYENADGDPLDIFAFNEQFEDLDELIEEAEIEVEDDELFFINGQKVLIGEFGSITSALFIKGDAVVIVDAFVTIEQMQTIVAAILNSN